MMNPAKLLKLKKSWDEFSGNHPKFVNFMKAVSKKGAKEGTLIEITVTTPEGETISSNLKITKSDEEMIAELGELFKN